MDAFLRDLMAHQWNLKRDFHATGDGQTDDSAALLKAVESIKNGVLFIPKGTYVISKRIDISKGNLILRGDGPNKTILLIPPIGTSTRQAPCNFLPRTLVHS